MIKADIIKSVETQRGISYEDASIQVEQILTLIKDELTNGERV